MDTGGKQLHAQHRSWFVHWCLLSAVIFKCIIWQVWVVMFSREGGVGIETNLSSFSWGPLSLLYFSLSHLCMFALPGISD